MVDDVREEDVRVREDDLNRSREDDIRPREDNGNKTLEDIISVSNDDYLTKEDKVTTQK